MKEEFHEKNITLSCVKEKKLLVAYDYFLLGTL